MNPFTYFHFLDHHSYFIHSFSNVVQHLKDTLKEKFHIDHHQNPDFTHEKHEVFGIDESRKVKSSHLAKSFTEGGKRIFIIECESMTHEAQNSLLKIFEEPNEDTHFFLIMPSTHTLLPTLKSRLLVINKPDDNSGSIFSEEVKRFLKLSKKDKVTFVDDMAKQLSDEEITKQTILEFLSALEANVYNDGVEKNSAVLKSIITARKYIGDRSPSVKQLLEFVALSL